MSAAVSQLEQAFHLLRQQPVSASYRDICQSLGVQAMTSDPWQAAFYFTEGHGVTFRHQALMNTHRKLRYQLICFSCIRGTDFNS